MASRPAPRRIVGIDFSGARDAGRLIWIAEGLRDADALRLVSCQPASALPGGGSEREPALAALVAHIATLGDALVGIDVPFGIPESMFPTPVRDWRGFLERFSACWPSPETFRAGCRAATPGRKAKRDTDREAATPFAPHNVRIYRMTWHGIAALLAPLVLTGRAAAVPMQEPAPGRPTLLEVCPASLLKRGGEGLDKGYKGRASAHRAKRQTIIAWLVAGGHLHPPPPAQERLILDNSGGDALDAVIAAIIAMAASADPANLRPRADRERADRLEARVYF